MTDRTRPLVTGAGLRTPRRSMQAELACAASTARQTVSHWERQPVLGLMEWACRRMFRALGIRVRANNPTLSRARGDGVLRNPRDPLADRALQDALAALSSREAQRRTLARIPCGAKTRKGHACGLLSEPGGRRCKFHGGMSTGPRSPEGRARIAEAQRKRWRKKRETKTDIDEHLRD